MRKKLIPTILTTTFCPRDCRRSSSEELWLRLRRRGTRPEGNWRRSAGSTWLPGIRPLWLSALSTNTTATSLFMTSIMNTITLRANIVTVSTVTRIQVRMPRWFVLVQLHKSFYNEKKETNYNL